MIFTGKSLLNELIIDSKLQENIFHYIFDKGFALITYRVPKTQLKYFWQKCK